MKNPMDKTSATLSRFAVAYSIDVAKNLQKFEVPTVVNLPAEIENYPRFMCYASFGALIPTSVRGYKLIRSAYLYHQIRLDRILNSKVKDYKPDISKVDNFLQISIDSTFYPIDKRVTALVNLGLIDSDGNVSEVYQDPLRTAAKVQRRLDGQVHLGPSELEKSRQEIELNKGLECKSKWIKEGGLDSRVVKDYNDLNKDILNMSISEGRGFSDKDFWYKRIKRR
ncbi:hypothetical protein RUM43_011186 [Polyplax serrata]|uniref:Uncharacterized protein n=1 Tax=Polyplax serrata TaxID=468196 RepID=A0AAN8P4S3_POLSC